MADSAQYVYALGGIITSLYFLYSPIQLYSIPTIGPSAPLLSYLGSYRFSGNAREMLQEGYSKYKVFKVALLEQWLVVVSGPEMNDELRKVPDSHVSFTMAAEEVIQTKHTIAPDVSLNPIHIPVIRGPLTRNLGVLFADVVEEIFTAFPEVMPVDGDDWVGVPVLDTMARVVSRASNRVFVGLPLCRNQDYLSTVVNFSFAVSKGRDVLSFVPGLLKGVVGKLLPWSRRAIRKVSAYVKPMILERQRKMKELGEDWTDKPNDFLMWLIEEAQRVGQTTDLIVQGILASNFAAIHTSSHSVTHALYDLAAHPEYIQPLREEVEAVIKEHGWTKVAIGKMFKLDSFMRESQRMNGISGSTPQISAPLGVVPLSHIIAWLVLISNALSPVSVLRKVLQNVTLSDGTRLPKGTLVVAAAEATHLDQNNYENAKVFDPFRFSNMRTEESDRIKHQYVSTSGEFISFGHGKHACPGRFFAVNELKVMMAYMVLNFDMKFEHGRARPDNVWIWHWVIPPDVKVMFRKRQAAKV